MPSFSCASKTTRACIFLWLYIQPHLFVYVRQPSAGNKKRDRKVQILEMVSRCDEDEELMQYICECAHLQMEDWRRSENLTLLLL